jgi:hypothetical protein
MSSRFSDLFARAQRQAQTQPRPTLTPNSAANLRNALASITAPQLRIAPPPPTRGPGPGPVGGGYTPPITRAIPPAPVLPDPAALIRQVMESAPQRGSVFASTQPPVKTPQQTQDEPWAVYESPSGPVALPISWGEANPDFRMMGDPITDPEQIKRAKNSDFAYDNLSDERKAEIRQPEAAPGPAVNRNDPTARNLAIMALQQNAERMEQDALRSGTMAPPPKPKPDKSILDKAGDGIGGVVGAVKEFLIDDTIEAARTVGQEINDPGHFMRGLEVIGDAVEKVPGGDKVTDYIADTSLPEAGSDLMKLIRATPADELADVAWNGTIPGTDTTIGDIGSAIWNKDLPGFKASVGDVATGFIRYLGVAQHDLMTAYIDGIVEDITGTEIDTTSAIGSTLRRIPMAGDALGGVLEGIAESGIAQDIMSEVMGPTLPRWIEDNPEAVRKLHETGYDADGDGTPDIFGADAVYAYWEDNEASFVEAIWVQLVTDPLSWLPVVGQAGKATKAIGAANRMAPGAGAARRVLGGLGELTGESIYRGSRAGEIVADLGLEPALNLVKRGIDATGLTAPHATSRQEIEAETIAKGTADATGVDVQIKPVIVYGPDGRVIGSEPGPSPVGGSSAEIPIAETPTVEPPSPRVAEADPDAGDAPRAEARTPDGDLIIADDVATGLNDTRILQEDTGSHVIERTGTDGTITRVPVASLDDAWRVVNDDLAALTDAGIPGRWLPREGGSRVIDQLPLSIYNELSARMANEWTESANVQDTLGRGTPLVSHAIESSRIALRTRETLRDISTDLGTRGDLPEWEVNSTSYDNAAHAATEHAIRLPWNETTGIREFLNGSKAIQRQDGSIARPRYPVASPKPLSPKPTRQAITAANNYVDIIYQHVQWHPESFKSRAFRQAWQSAVNLDADLRARGLRRSPGGIDVGPLSRQRLPNGRTVRPTIDTSNVARVTNTPGEAAPAPAPNRKTDIMDRYPSEVESDGERVVYLSDDPGGATVYIRTVRFSEVPEEWQAFHANATKRSPRSRWYEAYIEWYVGGEKGPGSYVYAPTERQAIGLAAEEARELGLLPDDPPQRNGHTVTMRVMGEPAPPAPEPEPTVEAAPEVSPEVASTGWTPNPRIAVDRAASPSVQGRQLDASLMERFNILTPEGYDQWLSSASQLRDQPVALAAQRGILRAAVDLGGNLPNITPRGNPVRYRTYRPDPDAMEQYLVIDVGDGVQIHVNTTRGAYDVRINGGPVGVATTLPEAIRIADGAVGQTVPVANEAPAPRPATRTGAKAQRALAQRRERARILNGEEGARLDAAPEPEPPGEPEVPAAERRAAIRQQAARALYGEPETPEGVTLDDLEPDTSSLDPIEVTPETPTVKDPTGIVDVPQRELADPDPEVTLDEPDIHPDARKILENPPARPPKFPGDNPSLYAKALDRVHRKVTSTRLYPARNGAAVNSRGEATWNGHPVTDEQVHHLTRLEFTDGKYRDDGKTFMSRVSYRMKRMGDKDRWLQHEGVYEQLAIEQTYAEYLELLKELYPDGVLPQRLSKAINNLPRPIKQALAAVAWALRGPVRATDAYMQYRRERALLSLPRTVTYPGLQFIGNSLNLILDGDPAALRRYWSRRQYMAARRVLMESGNPKTPAWQKDPLHSSGEKMHAALGTRQGKWITEMKQTQLGNLNDDLITTKAMTKLFGPRWGRGLGLAFGTKKTAINAAAFDYLMRDVKDQAVWTREMRTTLPDYRNQTIGKLMDWGMDRAEATALWDEFYDSLGNTWQFNMDKVIDFFEPRLDKGKAIRLGRDWQETVRAVEKRVEPQVKRVTFAGEETRADLVLKRLFFFHHFASRQSWFYATQAARHPFLINLYFNVQEELEKASEGWPDYLQNWVKLMVTPYGYALFLNPVALSRTFVTFLDAPTTFEDPANTVVGKIANQIEGIIGINPLAKEVLNLSGALGDTFAPDPLAMWQEANIVTTAINFSRAYGLLGNDPTPIGNKLTQLGLELREDISGLNPLRDEAIDATSDEAEMDRDVQMLVIDQLQRDDPTFDPETEEGQALVTAIMLDPESETYLKAVKRFVNGEAAAIGIRAVVGMFSPRQRPVNEAGEDLYHSFSREVKNFINTTDPRMMTLRDQEGRYHELGTPEVQTAEDVWNQVAYGFIDQSVEVGGVIYSSADVNRMSKDERVALANALLQDYGYLDDYNTLKDDQDKYLAQPENAEYATYRRWQKAVRGYPGGIEAYWEAAIKDNPNAERYYNRIMDQPMLPSQREQALTNMNAFSGIAGIQESVWDPIPESTGRNGVYDPVNIANDAPSPTPYEESNAEYKDEVRKAPEVLYELQQWDQAVSQKQAQMGYDPSIPFSQLEYEDRTAIEDSLEADGISEPKVSWQVQQYIDWAAEQPAGADTSVDAYLVANEQNYQEAAGERLIEELAKPEALPGPDKTGNVVRTPEQTQTGNLWRDILVLLDEHDHKKYPQPGEPGGDWWFRQYLP